MPQHFFIPKALHVDSIKRVLMVAVHFPFPVRFALKKILISFENSYQNVDNSAAFFFVQHRDSVRFIAPIPIHIKYDGIGFIPLEELTERETA